MSTARSNTAWARKLKETLTQNQGGPVLTNELTPSVKISAQIQGQTIQRVGGLWLTYKCEPAILSICLLEPKKISQSYRDSI